MAHFNAPLRKDLPIVALAELVKLAHSYPAPNWDFEEWTHTSVILSIQTANLEVAQYANVIKEELQLRGCVVLGLDRVLNDLPAGEAAAVTTILLSYLGTPLRVFLKHPHWRRLEVDLNRPSASSGGVGDQPLHMDFVNADNPPDLVCLLSVRPDPLGGGASPIASLDGLDEEIDPVNREILSRRLYKDGEVHNLNGIGHDINPFPVLAPGTRWAYRYTRKLIDSAPNEEARKALQVADNILTSRKMSYMLSRGDLLILNQHRFVHGRQALGQKQHQVPKDRRRLLLQSFIRLEIKPQELQQT